MDAGHSLCYNSDTKKLYEPNYFLESVTLSRPKIEHLIRFFSDFITYICSTHNGNPWKNALLYSAYLCFCAY